MMEHDGVAISSYPRVRAIYSYNARSEKELNFKANDLLTVLDIVSDAWWEGAFNGVKGYIPAAYVEHSPVDGAAENGEHHAAATPTPSAPTQADPAPTHNEVSSDPVAVSEPPAAPIEESLEQLSVNGSENEENVSPTHRHSELGAEPEAPPPPPGLLSELHGELGVRAPAAEVLAEGQGRAPEGGSPMIARRAKAEEDRPDLATALKIHQMKAKHKDLAPRKGGPNEIQQQLHRMQSRRGDKQAEAAAQETEFAKAMRGQRDRMEAQKKEQEKQANMSELEKKFFARKNTERRE
eukprot:m.29935 g.29935  ORF g.29935 m.29935 type:complete len:295 (-) comp9205_c0_seq2:202-1086(-)